MKGENWPDVFQVMDVVWSIVLLIFTIIEYGISTRQAEESVKVPLSKALGLSIVKNLEKTLQNEIAHEYTMLNNELMKGSQEAIGNIEDENSDFGTDLIRIKNSVDRRRSVRIRSEVGRRRSRSQALRRQKLNSQSLRSHLQHSKRATSNVER